MSRWPILLLVLLASALGLAACGGDDGEDADPAAVLKETFGEGKSVKSGRLDLSLRINAKGIEQLNGPVTVALRGPFQSQGGNQLPQFDFEAEINAGGQAFRAGAVSTGDKGFLRFQDQAYSVPDELYKQFKDGYAKTAKCNEEQGGKQGNATFRALGIDPRRWLKKPRNEGVQSVGGTDTIHIASAVDVPRFLEDVNRVLGRTDLQQADPCAEEEQTGQPKEDPASRQLTEDQRKKIAEAIKEARVDVWSGSDDRILRRINVDLRVESADRKQSGDVRLDLTIGGLNEKQQVKAPADTKPLEELLQRFGGQVPDLGSGSGGGGTDGGGGAGSTYEQCVAEAGGDVRKLQECGDLLEQ